MIEGEGLRQCHMCCALDQPACISTGDQRTCSSDEGISYSVKSVGLLLLVIYSLHHF